VINERFSRLNKSRGSAAMDLHALSKSSDRASHATVDSGKWTSSKSTNCRSSRQHLFWCVTLRESQSVAMSVSYEGAESERRSYEERIARVPATAMTSGMYVVGLHRQLRKAGVRSANPDAYACLQYYPLREFMAFMLDAAALLFPRMSMDESLKRFGLMVIPNFAESMGGKVIMSLGQCNWDVALSCVTRGYQLSLRPGRAKVKGGGRGRADVDLRDIWCFGESYQVGVIQGLMNWYGINGTVQPEALSPSHTVLHLSWLSH
jgi:uncharacterized protein (TIGR02265 family)